MDFFNRYNKEQQQAEQQHQMFKEDLEDDLPEFAPKDEDKKKHSY
jgi:hypothetical protein